MFARIQGVHHYLFMKVMGQVHLHNINFRVVQDLSVIRCNVINSPLPGPVVQRLFVHITKLEQFGMLGFLITRIMKRSDIAYTNHCCFQLLCCHFK